MTGPESALNTRINREVKELQYKSLTLTRCVRLTAC